MICDRMLAQKITPQEKEKFRVIPCLTVTGEGLLEGFRPDYIEIAGENINIKTSDAVSYTHLESGTTEVFLSLRLLLKETKAFLTLQESLFRKVRKGYVKKN